jgi:hypothetical protein
MEPNPLLTAYQNVNLDYVSLYGEMISVPAYTLTRPPDAYDQNYIIYILGLLSHCDYNIVQLANGNVLINFSCHGKKIVSYSNTGCISICDIVYDHRNCVSTYNVKRHFKYVFKELFNVPIV